MEEPSILDYLKAKLTPWRGKAPEIPPLEGGEPAAPAESPAPAEAAGPEPLLAQLERIRLLRPALQPGQSPCPGALSSRCCWL